VNRVHVPLDISHLGDQLFQAIDRTVTELAKQDNTDSPIRKQKLILIHTRSSATAVRARI